MPFLKTITFSPISISFWRIDEREDEMLLILPPDKKYAETAARFRSARRRKEWLATRCLLHLLLGTEAELTYLPSGKPQLSHDTNADFEISVSHSSEWAALALAPKGREIGLDVECFGERAYKLRHRFLSNDELPLANNEQQACLMWCAKEAVYKLCDTAGLRFLEDMKLQKKSGQLYIELPTLKKRAIIHSHIEEKHGIAFALFSSE